MKDEQIIEVIDKLVGGIEPIGDSNYDNQAKENLNMMTEIVGHYVDEICEIAQKDSCMASIQECQAIAKNFIKGLKDAYESCHSNWIPCEEMLPENDKKVLVWYKGAAWDNGEIFYDYAIARRRKFCADWVGEFPGEPLDVIAWQPLSQCELN